MRKESTEGEGGGRRNIPLSRGNWYMLCHGTVQSPFPSLRFTVPDAVSALGEKSSPTFVFRRTITERGGRGCVCKCVKESERERKRRYVEISMINECSGVWKRERLCERGLIILSLLGA